MTQRVKWAEEGGLRNNSCHTSEDSPTLGTLRVSAYVTCITHYRAGTIIWKLRNRGIKSVAQVDSQCKPCSWPLCPPALGKLLPAAISHTQFLIVAGCVTL